MITRWGDGDGCGGGLVDSTEMQLPYLVARSEGRKKVRLQGVKWSLTVSRIIFENLNSRIYFC